MKAKKPNNEEFQEKKTFQAL
jgi:translation initiation factor eIF-2B subunit epsilon